MLALAVLAAPPAGAQSGLPGELAEVGIDQRLDEQLPLDVVFRDESGAESVRANASFASSSS